ncbi:4Fe-4S binding protein [bacterium]|nr:4Fe-4S binding protein [bacterium]
MKVIRKIIEIDEGLCNGCGQCADACSEGAIRIIDGKARLVAEKYCDGLGVCIGECPAGAIKILEREADEFDAEAVEDYLKMQGTSQESSKTNMQTGGPSTLNRGSRSSGKDKESEKGKVQTGPASSYLTNWPVQIRLVPAAAPFLKDAHLLVAADCTTLAAEDFHRDFLKGKAVMIGCPKFDDPAPYINKFTDIFKHDGIRKVTALVMEVPCCQGLPMIIKKGMELAGKDIPLIQIVISTKGKVISRKKV